MPDAVAWLVPGNAFCKQLIPQPNEAVLKFSLARWMKWVFAFLVLALLAAGVLRALSARQAQTDALKASSAAQAALSSVVELAQSDVIRVRPVVIAQGLAVSGTLKAVNSAMVKARVSGELQALTVREGDAVKAGQVVARIDAGEVTLRLRQAREQAASSRAQVEVVQRQYDNNKALVDQGFISRSALDTSLANLNASRATFNAAQAAAEVAARSVKDAVLTAPISGLVSQRLAQPGERVGVDARILEIVDLSRLEVEVTLSAADAASVQVGQRALLQVEGSRTPIQAHVARINPSAQSGSRNLLAYLAIDNNNASEGGASLLRQGLFAQGTLGTRESAQLAVPTSAIRTDQPAPYVQAVENGLLVYKPVVLGLRGMAGSEAVTAITAGLNAEALVLRSTVGVLREGVKVRFTPVP